MTRDIVKEIKEEKVKRYNNLKNSITLSDKLLDKIKGDIITKGYCLFALIEIPEFTEEYEYEVYNVEDLIWPYKTKKLGIKEGKRLIKDITPIAISIFEDIGFEVVLSGCYHPELTLTIPSKKG